MTDATLRGRSGGGLSRFRCPKCQIVYLLTPPPRDEPDHVCTSDQHATVTLILESPTQRTT